MVFERDGLVLLSTFFRRGDDLIFDVGISYLVIDAEYMEAFAPVVARLAGQ